MPSAEYDPEFLNIKYYLSEIKSYLYELQQYNVNFFQEGSSGNNLISHMIMNKLPEIVVKELINKINNYYPGLEQIFNSYKEVLKTLIRTVPGRKNIKDKKISSGNNNNHRFEIKAKSKLPTIQNVEVGAISKGAKMLCKLCASEGHTMGKYETYPNYEAKLAKLLELSLCTRCAGSGHNESECYGKKGKLRFPCLLCKKKST